MHYSDDNTTTPPNPTPVFEFKNLVDLTGMPPARAKNWIIGRPVKMITPSIPTHGSRNLFSLEDVYQFALAYELSKAGLTAEAIKALLDEIKKQFRNGLGGIETLTAWRRPRKAQRKAKVDPAPQLGRPKSDPAGYEITESRVRPPDDRVVCLQIDVKRVIERVTSRIGALK